MLTRKILRIFLWFKNYCQIRDQTTQLSIVDTVLNDVIIIENYTQLK